MAIRIALLPQACVVLLLAVSASMSAAAEAAALPLVWHGITEIAAGKGERGPWRQNDSRYDFVDDPSVALDKRGNAAVVWVEQARKDIFYQRLSADGGKQPAQPVNVSRSPATFSWLPRIVIAPDAQNSVFVLWQEIIFSGGSHGGDILFARSNDGGNTFSPPINLSQSLGGDGKGRINRDIWHNGSLDVIAGKDGALYAAWTEYDGPLWFSRSNDGGASFARPRRLAGSRDRPARAPSLALGPDGAVYLAWTVGEDNAADIRIAKSIDAGASFSEPRIIVPSPGYSDAPKLAVDANGVLHLAFAEGAGGPFGRYRIQYARSSDGARSFEAPRDISSVPAKSNASAGFPALCVDSKGYVYVLWETFGDYRQRPRGLALAVSPDAGRSFTQPMLVPASSDPAGGTNGSSQGLLMKKIAVNDAGDIAIVNSSLKQNERSRVWLIRAANGVQPASAK